MVSTLSACKKLGVSCQPLEKKFIYFFYYIMFLRNRHAIRLLHSRETSMVWVCWVSWEWTHNCFSTRSKSLEKFGAVLWSHLTLINSWRNGTIWLSFRLFWNETKIMAIQFGTPVLLSRTVAKLWAKAVKITSRAWVISMNLPTTWKAI